MGFYSSGEDWPESERKEVESSRKKLSWACKNLVKVEVFVRVLVCSQNPIILTFLKEDYYV